MVKNFWLLIVFLLFSVSAMAHKDRIIELDESGHLNGLPDKYLPASFDINTWSLTIAGNSFSFPECIRIAFSEVSKDQLFFTSSWYHIRIHEIPAYLNIEVKPKKFSVLIALDTAKPFNRKYENLTEGEICELLKK